MTPIHLSTTFAQNSPGKPKAFSYGRAGNPTRQAYEECLASLENGKFCSTFSSGCAATQAICQLFSSESHIISSNDIYGGTFRLFENLITNNAITFSYIDLSQPQNLLNSIRSHTKMLWLESPTNPLLNILDISKICQLAKEKNILTVIDNTFLSPYFQNPLNLGADIVFHSTTKYINGHSDVIGGAVITNNSEIAEKLKFIQKAAGAIPSPFDCYLSLRGLKTLSVRMRQHEHNAKQIALYLKNNSKVEKVLYPGLEEHPHYSISKKQMSGFGGMISFYLKGNEAQTKTFLENVKIFSLADSLGGVESLIGYPTLMTHASVPKEIKEKIGITDTLIRLSVGIEDVQDLINDLEQAFLKIG